EPDPAEPEVGPERDEQAEQELVLEDADAELRDERPDRGEGRPDPAADLPPIGSARLDRFVVADLSRQLAWLVRVELRRQVAHRLIVAAGLLAAGNVAIVGKGH